MRWCGWRAAWCSPAGASWCRTPGLGSAVPATPCPSRRAVRRRVVASLGERRHRAPPRRVPPSSIAAGAAECRRGGCRRAPAAPPIVTGGRSCGRAAGGRYCGECHSRQGRSWLQGRQGPLHLRAATAASVAGRRMAPPIVTGGRSRGRAAGGRYCGECHSQHRRSWLPGEVAAPPGGRHCGECRKAPPAAERKSAGVAAPPRGPPPPEYRDAPPAAACPPGPVQGRQGLTVSVGRVGSTNRGSSGSSRRKGTSPAVMARMIFAWARTPAPGRSGSTSLRSTGSPKCTR